MITNPSKEEMNSRTTIFDQNYSGVDLINRLDIMNKGVNISINSLDNSKSDIT